MAWLNSCRSRPIAARRGAILPLITLLLPVLLILGAFVVNLAYMELTRAELRVASDSATRAAGYTLNATGDKSLSLQAAKDAAGRNLVAGKALKLAAKDVVFGVAKRANLASRYVFTPGGTTVNAVQVNASRAAGSASGVVSLPMPGFGAVKTFGPQQLAVSSQVELDIALVLDRSGSMAYGDFELSDVLAGAGLPPTIAPPGWWWGKPAPTGCRWLNLVDAVNVFLAQLTKSPANEFVSVVTYSDAQSTDVPLTSSYGAIPKALGVYSAAFPEGRTGIGDGIALGVNSLSSSGRPWAAKVIIVMTDGRHNTGSDPVGAAASAFSQGIGVYAVTFSDDAELWRMDDVAAAGGGKHWHAARKNDLIAVFKEIGSSLPTLLVK